MSMNKPDNLIPRDYSDMPAPYIHPTVPLDKQFHCVGPRGIAFVPRSLFPSHLETYAYQLQLAEGMFARIAEVNSEWFAAIVYVLDTDKAESDPDKRRVYASAMYLNTFEDAVAFVAPFAALEEQQ